MAPHRGGRQPRHVAHGQSLLESLAARWGHAGSAPIGSVNAPGGRKALYRSTTMRDGS